MFANVVELILKDYETHSFSACFFRFLADVLATTTAFDNVFRPLQLCTKRQEVIPQDQDSVTRKTSSVIV